MSQYKPHVLEEDTRSAWERRTSGIQGHFAEEEEQARMAGYAREGWQQWQQLPAIRSPLSEGIIQSEALIQRAMRELGKK